MLPPLYSLVLTPTHENVQHPHRIRTHTLKENVLVFEFHGWSTLVRGAWSWPRVSLSIYLSAFASVWGGNRPPEGEVVVREWVVVNKSTEPKHSGTLTGGQARTDRFHLRRARALGCAAGSATRSCAPCARLPLACPRLQYVLVGRPRLGLDRVYTEDHAVLP